MGALRPSGLAVYGGTDMSLHKLALLSTYNNNNKRCMYQSQARPGVDLCGTSFSRSSLGYLRDPGYNSQAVVIPGTSRSRSQDGTWELHIILLCT